MDEFREYFLKIRVIRLFAQFAFEECLSLI
jgi:hypothetical protein